MPSEGYTLYNETVALQNKNGQSNYAHKNGNALEEKNTPNNKPDKNAKNFKFNTKEGVIKHKALSAMEDQTNMQLNQIKEQIELLARQAQEIRKRKELSMMIYEAKITFKPQIGQVYHVYEKQDGSHVLSMVAPHEWGGGAGPFAQFIATVKLLADHTWDLLDKSD